MLKMGLLEKKEIKKKKTIKPDKTHLFKSITVSCCLTEILCFAQTRNCSFFLKKKPFEYLKH